MAQRQYFSAERLRGLFEPRSIALIGASDKSAWSIMLHSALVGGQFEGKVYYINPKAETVHAQPAVPSLAAINEPVDLAFLMIPPTSVLGVLEEMAVADIHNAVILTSGFAEAGEEGQLRQQKMVELARDHDIAIVGPNCLGFINISKNIAAMTSAFDFPLLKGPVALISQSGALGNIMLNYATDNNIGLSALISTGNEAVVSVVDAMSFFLEDEATKAVAIFLESVRDPEQFIGVAKRAQELGKPIVALKAGRSQLTAKLAQAHTGSLVGDDKVIDALFKQLDIVRVDSPEELIITANLLAHTAKLAGNRLGIISISGGACDLSADQAEQLNIALPQFDETTKSGIKELVATLHTVHNPLDITGMVVGSRTLFGDALEVVGRDPNLDVQLCLMEFPVDESPQYASSIAMLEGIARGLNNSKCPSFLVTALHRPVNAVGRKIISSSNMPYLAGGLQKVLAALSKAMWWSERQQQYQASSTVTTSNSQFPKINLSRAAKGPWSEYQARELLKHYDISLVPAVLAASAGEASKAASELGFPVVLKIASPDILHKSDIGGVKLNLRSEEEVQIAFEEVLKAANSSRPEARLEGVLVSPMRSGGVELLAGIVHDPLWGQVLAVGLGGIWVEILKDVSMRVLPVSKQEVRVMLEELKGLALLKGARGYKPADLDKVAETIYRVTEVAQAYREKLESLEINPLRVDGSQVEALDALITWRN